MPSRSLKLIDYSKKLATVNQFYEAKLVISKSYSGNFILPITITVLSQTVQKQGLLGNLCLQWFHEVTARWIEAQW